MDGPLPVTLAISPYDHVRDLVSGKVQVEGVDLTCLELPIPEIFRRFPAEEGWDLAELGLAKYVAKLARGDTSLTALPIFPNRWFPLTSMVFVRRDGPSKLEDLAEARIGILDWAQTSAIYVRGLLQDRGIDLGSITWIRAGLNEPKPSGDASVAPPADVSVKTVDDTSLNDLLLAGELDAVMTPLPPESYGDADGGVIRFLDGAPDLELEHWESTGVFPIMHLIAVRRDRLEKHPWLASSLVRGFEQARDRSTARLLAPGSQIPLPGIRHYASRANRTFGQDGYWPYGLEPNRVTLEAFLRYAHSQGVTPDLLATDQLFL